MRERGGVAVTDRYDKEQVRNALDARELAIRYRLHGKANQRGHYHTYRCISPDHDDKNPSMSVSQHRFVCRSCGHSGDVFDLIAEQECLDVSSDFQEVLAIGADIGGVPPLYYERRETRANRRTMRRVRATSRRVETFTDETREEHRAYIHEKLWGLVKDLPLSKRASSYLASRGLDPNAMHRLGVRDWSLALANIERGVLREERSVLEHAGLYDEDKGGIWLPLREMLAGNDNYAGVVIPVYWPGHDHPMGWRWRLIHPLGNIKTLGHGTSGHSDILGLDRAHAAHTVIVCEGEPDYLSVAECVEDLDGVEAIGLCSIVATDTRQGHWLEHLEGMERGIFAVHFDRDKTTGARAEVARHNFYGAGASGKQQGLAQGMVAYFGEGARDAIEQFRVLDIDGAHDLNDWHKAGELEDAIPTWLDATSTLDIDVSHEWRECLNESVHAHVQDTLERAEQREAERAKGAYINPLDAPEVIELSGVEARIKRELTDTLTHGGIKAIAITPGSGKTTITARYMSPALLSGEVKALDWASPSITVRDELASKLREGLEGHGMTHERRLLEHQMSPLPTRSDESCYMFDVWTAASRANPEGGNVICSGCEHHIQNTSGKGLCPYWQSVQARGGSGRVRTMTSEKLVRSHGYIANVPGLEPEQVEKDVEIKWSAIASLARGGGKFRPHLRESPSCILLELVRDEEGGEELALEVEEITTDDVEGTTLYRLTKDGREQLLAWFANIFDCEATPESVREAASAREVDQPTFDTLVIDEFLGDVLRDDVKAGVIELEWIRQTLDIDAEQFVALLDLLEESRQHHPRDARRFKRIPGERIAKVFEGTGTRPFDFASLQTEDIELAASIHWQNRTERLDVLSHCNDWRLIAAFLRALDNGFAECYMQGGELTLAFVRRVDFSKWRSIFALDATLSGNVARALFGDQAEHVHLEVEKPEHVKIVWVPYSLGKSTARHGNFQRERARDVFLSTHKLSDTPDTLHLTHKGWRKESSEEFEDDGDLPFTAKFFEECEGQVIHYAGAESSGWNGAEDCRVLVASTYHANSGAVRSLAWTLCEAVGERWMDAGTRAKWLEESRFLLEGRHIIQAFERIRTIHASEDRPVTLVLVSERDPSSLGYPPDTIIEPDALVFQAMGVVRGPEGVADMVKAKLLSGDGVWCPNLDDDQTPNDVRALALEFAGDENRAQNWLITTHFPKKEANIIIDRMKSQSAGFWPGIHIARGENTEQTDTPCPRVCMIGQSAGFLSGLHIAQDACTSLKNTSCPQTRMIGQSAGFLSGMPLCEEGIPDKKPAPSHPMRVCEARVFSSVNDILRGCLKNHFGYSIDRFADTFGMGLVKGLTPGRGRPCVILHDASLTLDALLELARGMDAFEAIEVDGEVHSLLTEEDWRNDLSRALELLTDSPEAMEFNDLVKALRGVAPAGSLLLNSRDKAREAIKLAGGTIKVRAMWAELHEEHAPTFDIPRHAWPAYVPVANIEDARFAYPWTGDPRPGARKTGMDLSQRAYDREFHRWMRGARRIPWLATHWWCRDIDQWRERKRAGASVVDWPPASELMTYRCDEEYGERLVLLEHEWNSPHIGDWPIEERETSWAPAAPIPSMSSRLRARALVLSSGDGAWWRWRPVASWRDEITTPLREHAHWLAGLLEDPDCLMAEMMFSSDRRRTNPWHAPLMVELFEREGGREYQEELEALAHAPLVEGFPEALHDLTATERVACHLLATLTPGRDVTSQPPAGPGASPPGGEVVARTPEQPASSKAVTDEDTSPFTRERQWRIPTDAEHVVFEREAAKVLGLEQRVCLDELEFVKTPNVFARELMRGRVSIERGQSWHAVLNPGGTGVPRAEFAVGSSIKPSIELAARFLSLAGVLTDARFAETHPFTMAFWRQRNWDVCSIETNRPTFFDGDVLLTEWLAGLRLMAENMDRRCAIIEAWRFDDSAHDINGMVKGWLRQDALWHAARAAAIETSNYGFGDLSDVVAFYWEWCPKDGDPREVPFEILPDPTTHGIDGRPLESSQDRAKRLGQFF